MTETLGEWRARKKAQAARFTKLDPKLQLDESMDMGTGFSLWCANPLTALVIGRRAHDAVPAIDLTDEQIERWAAQVRACRGE